MGKHRNKADGERKQRAPRGSGRLYKRDASGHEHPADWNGAGAYWLAYTIEAKNQKTGEAERTRVRAPLKDAKGEPITDHAQAEAARRVMLAPFMAKDAAEAQRQILSRLQTAEQRLEAATDAARPGLRIADAWKRYEESPTRPDAGKATLRQYGFQWQRFAQWIATAHPTAGTVADVSPKIAQEYAADLLANKVSANTFNKHIGLLLLVFRILSQDDAAGISSNPWDRIARRKQLSASRRELTTEELRRIVSAAAGETRLLFALGIYTGLRLGDCATLKWTEVDLPRGRIVRVPNKTARSSGKPVIVPLFSDLAGMLAEAYAVRRGEYVMPATAAVYAVKGADVLTRRIQRLFWNCGIECHAPGTGTQIKRKDDGAPVMTEKGNVELEPTGKRAVIACGFHSLRHSFVSLCRQANAPLSVVESIVGHSNPSMTRHYSHVGELEAARAIAALPAVLSVDADARTPERAPLPDWARELAETLTSKNAAKVRTALLAG